MTTIRPGTFQIHFKAKAKKYEEPVEVCMCRGQKGAPGFKAG